MHANAKTYTHKRREGRERKVGEGNNGRQKRESKGKEGEESEGSRGDGRERDGSIPALLFPTSSPAFVQCVALHIYNNIG